VEPPRDSIFEPTPVPVQRLPPPPGLTAWIEVLDAAARGKANVSDKDIDEALSTPSPDPAVAQIQEAILPLLRIRIPPNPDDEDARTSAIATGLMTLDLSNRAPTIIPPETPLAEREAELKDRIARHRIETPPATPSDITLWFDGPLEAEPPPVQDPELRKRIAELFNKVVPVLSHLDMASVPKPTSAQPPVPPAPTSKPIPTVQPPAVPPAIGAPTVEMPPAESAVEPPANEFITPGFEDRLKVAKEKFEAMRLRAEQSLDVLDASVKNNKVLKRKVKGRITNDDLNNHYKTFIFKADPAKVEEQRLAREARRTRRALKMPVPQVSPLSIVRKNLDDAKASVNEYAEELKSVQQEFPGQIVEDKWAEDTNKQLELEFDFLLRVERVLADVPAAVRVSPPSMPTDTLDKANAAIASAKATMEKTKAARERLNAVIPPKVPWKPGGTRRRKMRKSTFRRNRKH